MKKLLVFCATLVMVLTALASCERAQEEKVIELSLNLPIPPIHTRWKEATKPWLDELEKRTGGRLKVTPYFAQALSPMLENFDSIRNGTADMGECAMNVKPGLFPLHAQIFACGRPSRRIKNASRMMQELEAAFPVLGKELQGVKVLFLHVAAPGNSIGSSKRPIKALKDIRGMKLNLIGSGLSMEKVKALGASVVGMPMADVYMAAERGVIDGSVVGYELMVSRRWGDTIKHITNMSINHTPFYMVMNQGTWNKLPEDIQDIIDDMCGEYALDMYDKYWEYVDKNSREVWEKEMGGQTHLLSAVDMAKIDELTEPPVKEWIAEMENKGYPAKEILKKFRELEDKYSTPWVQ